MKIAASEAPFERRCRPLVVELEGEKTLFQFGQRSEVVGRENLSLYDGEIDFDLIKPAGVDGSVDEDRVGPFGAVAVDSLLSPMSGAIIHDPEDAASGLVRLLAHYFTDEALNRGHPVFDFAAPEDLGAMNIPSSYIGPGAFAKILILDPGGAIRSGLQRRLFSAPRLNTRLLVRRDHEVISTQWSAVPNALVEVEDGAGFGSKVGIPREDPASMLPRPESVGAEPTPQGGATDFGDEALRNHVLADLLNRETRQRKSEAVREFTGKRLNLDDEAGGKSGLYARREAALPDRVVG
jgi:hypothetical protein